MEKLEQGALSQLVRDSQAGDSQARERLVLSVQDYVHFYCRVMTDNPDDAMDAAQDILIAMLTGLKGLKDPEAFWGWLRQIVIRTCRKRTVRTRREQGRQRSLEAMQEEFDSGLAGPSELEELVESQEVRRTVMDLVNALPPQQRMCVLLFYYEEMPVEDIAAALHVPEGTVKSRLYYARKAIRRGAERSAQQGLPLYGLSPLPLLGAVLRREAAAAAGSAVSAGLAQAALAAGGTAAGITAKSVLSALAGRKAAILAGLAVAAVVTGSVLLPPEAPAVKLPAPSAVVQEVPPARPAPPPPPQESETTIRQETFTQPETAKPVALPASPVNETAVRPAPPMTLVTPPSPPEENAPEPPEVQEPVSLEPLPPQEELGSEPLPDIILESLSKPDTPPEMKPEPLQPSWNPGFNLPVDVPQPIIPPAQEDPEPIDPEPIDPEPVDPEPVDPEPVDPEPVDPEPVDPEPVDPEPVDPEPVDPEPVDPEPVDPGPEVITLTFGDENGRIGYGYTYSLIYAWNGVLPDGPRVYSSSNPSVVSVNEWGEFSTLAPGEAVLSAAAADDPTKRYDLLVTVENRFKWQYYLSDIVLQEGQSELCGLRAYSFSNHADYDVQLEGVEWTSSNPKVASIREVLNPGSCDVYAASPGTAAIRGTATFRVDTTEGERTMKDVFSFTVTVTEEPSAEPDPSRRKELTSFGVNSGYGYQSTFAVEWGGELPEGLVYASSNEDAVRISGETGEFYTVSAGESNLTATDPSEPDNPYVLIVQVQDCFQWTYTAEPLTLQVRQSAPCSITDCVLPDNTWAVYSTWISSDPSIASTSYSTYWQYNDVTCVRSGLTSITCIINFELKTFEGYVRMSDIVLFPVEVVPEPSVPLPDGSGADETA